MTFEDVVEVTAEDIGRGVRWDNGGCPIALAIKRAAGTEAVAVNESRIAIDDGRVITPALVRQFIRDFDRGLPVEPFGFSLDGRGPFSLDGRHS